MSTIKTLTSAATAIALVSGIGLAVAQSEEQPAQPAQATMTQATDQAVNDPNAPLPDTTAAAAAQQQQTPAPADPSMQQPAQPAPADANATYPAQDNSAATSSSPADQSSYQTTEPAPRADRN